MLSTLPRKVDADEAGNRKTPVESDLRSYRVMTVELALCGLNRRTDKGEVMGDLFVYELDGETHPTTVQTFAQDFEEYLRGLDAWREEQRIARLYGDCGYEI